MTIFEITPDDIHKLTDTQLRELVARLCHAELARCNLPGSAVAWGGNQTAPDGGLDVRVELPSSTCIHGYVPRPSTGFQVKKPDMPPSEIECEMRPGGLIRPVIQALADAGGAYVIVSSTGSTADGPWRSRLAAMRNALRDVSAAERLTTDFYDRRRVVDWVQQYPGVIAWVRQVSGRPLTGWLPFGPWSHRAEPVGAEYLTGDDLCLNLGSGDPLPVAHGLDLLRDKLHQPGRAVRLVGLSGVGKTRLAQALFDDRIGARPIPLHLAVYGDAGSELQPPPATLLENMIQQGREVVLIVDNCGPDLHRQLAEVCRTAGSRTRLLTIEYDIRDDLPEGTDVVTLTSQSDGVVTELLRRRHPALSWSDVHTIARLSEGNTRVALALAQAALTDGALIGLRDEQVFARLFWQHHQPDDRLSKVAATCALLYSFSVEDTADQGHELGPLAALTKQDEDEIYAHVRTLQDRGLVQQRGVWRAVLPHALANRLAGQALNSLRPGVVTDVLVAKGSPRLAKSFSRRLAYLHDNPAAQAIVRAWLTPPDGMLSNLGQLNDLGKAMFRNIAPVLPECSLAALERAAEVGEMAWDSDHVYLLESLAYDAELFERSVRLLAAILKNLKWNGQVGQLDHVLLTLFSQHFSGTHARVDQRLNVVQAWALGDDPYLQELSVKALGQMLQWSRIGVVDVRGFGGRSRDSGYRHSTEQAQAAWYREVFSLTESLLAGPPAVREGIRSVIAANLRVLSRAPDSVRALCFQLFRICSAGRFWREGWIAAGSALKRWSDDADTDVKAALLALVQESGPVTLEDRVAAWAFGDRWDVLTVLDLWEGDDPPAETHLEERLFQIAEELVTNPEAFRSVLPQLLTGGHGVWTLGRGFALHRHLNDDCRGMWLQMADAAAHIPRDVCSVGLLGGFLEELWKVDTELAHTLLDESLKHPSLRKYLPLLSPLEGIDQRGAERLLEAIQSGSSEPWTYRRMIVGHSVRRLPGDILARLLNVLAGTVEGRVIAMEVLGTYWRGEDGCDGRELVGSLLEVSKQLLTTVRSDELEHHKHDLLAIVERCLMAPGAEAVATVMALRIREAIQAGVTQGFNQQELFILLFKHQPLVAMDIALGGDPENRLQRSDLSEIHDDSSAIDVVPVDVLVAWCRQQPEERFPAAAALISFVTAGPLEDPPSWTVQALALIREAPCPEQVLRVFIDRFQPMQWSGSLAEVIRRRAALLDCLDIPVSDVLKPVIARARADLATQIDARSAEESRRERAERERFEW